MRIFLIIVSFINTLLYVLIYAYYDNILEILGTTLLSAGFQNFFKDLTLIIIGSCIGLMAIMFLQPKIDRSYFDVKSLILLGIVPFFLLLLSRDTISNFIISRFFSENNNIKEIIFYLFSRQVLWSLWFGFAIGASVRPNFIQSRRKHAVKYTLSDDNVMKPKQ